MLIAIRNAIAMLPNKSFGAFYQDYIRNSQDRIISHDIRVASNQFTSIEDTTNLLKGLNTLTEELKFL